MKRWLLFTFFSLPLSVIVLTIPMLMAESSTTNQQHEVVSQGRSMTQPTGEDVFKTNCARCHMPPMSLSPRTTGTVIMHMRTRARLSRQDEKLLLKYLAP